MERNDSDCRWFIQPRTSDVNANVAEFLSRHGVTLEEGFGTAEGACDKRAIPRSAYEFPGVLLSIILDHVWGDSNFKVRIFRQRPNEPLEECAFLLKRTRQKVNLVSLGGKAFAERAAAMQRE
ncbi:MAG: hypothetical protein V1696_00950 [Candidatus Jorgensenbacteria bacterium]